MGVVSPPPRRKSYFIRRTSKFKHLFHWYRNKNLPPILNTRNIIYHLHTNPNYISKLHIDKISGICSYKKPIKCMEFIFNYKNYIDIYFN